MNSQMILMVGTWSVLAAAYLVLYIYRKQLESQEDDTLHVLADKGVLSTQEHTAHKLDTLDRWSRLLGSVVIVYGLIIAGIYLYSVWQSSSTLPS